MTSFRNAVFWATFAFSGLIVAGCSSAESMCLTSEFGFLSIVPLGDVTVSIQAVDSDGTVIQGQLVVKS